MAGRTGRRAASRLLWVLLLLTVCSLAVAGSAEAAADRVLAITEDKAQPSESWNTFDTDPLELHDFDGDGAKEIVALNDNNWVYVFDSRSGELLFEAETTEPGHWSARSFNGPEAARVDEAGTQKLIVANSAAVVTSFRFDPQASTDDDFAFDREWERRLNTCHDDPGMDAKPVLADLDQDGEHEILLTTEELGIYALNQDGSEYWHYCIGGGNAPPAVADLNQDGNPEVVHANDAGLVVALDGRTGDWIWGYDILDHHDVGSGSIPAAPGIGQLDGVGGPDIVVGARDSHDPDNWDENHVLLLALDHEGNELWSFQDAEGNPLTYTTPVVEDAIGNDGVNEVYWADWNTVGHKPPTGDDAWERTGPGNFYRLEADGDLVWRKKIDTWWQNKDVPVADVDGDGHQEMLATGPNADKSEDGVWYLDIYTGNREAFVSAYPWKIQRAPVVADMWGHGTTQWAMAASPQTHDAGGHAILVYDTGVGYDPVWPAMPEHELGSGSTETDSSGETFSATFRISSPNEWWQELYVEPDDGRAIASAEVRIDGGDWLPMDESDWGAWTSSYHSPEGSQIEFRAWDGAGDRSVSQPFTWLSGEQSKEDRHSGGSSGAGDGSSGDFEADFRVGDGSNEWWIEVYVDSNHALHAVHASINGDDWKPLEKRDWGAWAKSYRAPSGSEVQFRAMDSSGDTTTSQRFVWLSDGQSDGGGGGDGFDPRFDPADDRNEWWIEVYVDSDHALHAVDVSIDGGDWKPLETTDWGSWAKSYHAPQGSEVQFRATDSSGDTATSQRYPWP